MLETVLCCKRSYKPEPISVVICRKFVVILFVLITLVVLVILSIGVNNDTPTITRKYSTMDKFPVPVFYISFAYQHKITCVYFFTTNMSEIGIINNEYVKQPTYNNSSDDWNGSFFPDNLSFITGDINKTQNQVDITALNLVFDITDPDYDDDSYRFSISMHDQEYNPFNDSLVNVTEDYSIFAKSLQDDVYYNTGTQYDMRLSRKRRTLLKDSILNNLGLPQRYPGQSYVVEDISIYDTTKSSKAIFLITPLSFSLENEVEQRNKNALSVVSNVLAVWGGLTALYIFLFGADAIKPWGFIQERILKNETRNKLTSAPFSKKEGTPEERIEALETFLKNYVVDVSLIDQSNKSPYQKINPSS